MGCEGLLHVGGNTDTTSHYTHGIEFNTYFLKISDENNQTAKHLGKNHIHIHMHTVYILHTIFILFTLS